MAQIQRRETSIRRSLSGIANDLVHKPRGEKINRYKLEGLLSALLARKLVLRIIAGGGLIALIVEIFIGITQIEKLEEQNRLVSLQSVSNLYEASYAQKREFSLNWDSKRGLFRSAPLFEEQIALLANIDSVSANNYISAMLTDPHPVSRLTGLKLYSKLYPKISLPEGPPIELEYLYIHNLELLHVPANRIDFRYCIIDNMSIDSTAYISRIELHQSRVKGLYLNSGSDIFVYFGYSYGELAVVNNSHNYIILGNESRIDIFTDPVPDSSPNIYLSPLINSVLIHDMYTKSMVAEWDTTGLFSSYSNFGAYISNKIGVESDSLFAFSAINSDIVNDKQRKVINEKVSGAAKSQGLLK
ncbi:hypothetical protein AB9P05_12785 [Roseivirga sp. BDSF3-8]|uniref:hypothetical protein n=1 Tax=Roseivirga sp. BDSF3-8 TaxID=3241598 RepID=UPI0035322B28